MSQIKLSSKWVTEDEANLGGILHYVKSKEGEKSMSKLTKTAMAEDNQGDQNSEDKEDSDLAAIMGENNEQSSQPEVSMDSNSAIIAIMSRLEYSSSAKIDQAFNLVADIMKLPLDSRKVEKEEKIMWVNDNTDKISPKDLMSVYKILSD
jgi:hypothetical protein